MGRNSVVGPQSMLFTLYGDYILHRGGEVWVGTLIRVLIEFGLSEQAIRSALSRMSRNGWLNVERVGKKPYYSLTPKGKRLLSEGAQLIYHGRHDHWDGKWHLLTYSIPEGMRDVRNRLRKELSWLGYGMLSNATWMCPRDVNPQLKSLIDTLNIGQFVETFTATHNGFSEGKELVARCWDLDSINKEYAKFLDKYRPRVETYLERQRNGNPLEASECFVERFMLIHEYRKFPFIDPELPIELLPDGWLGGEAASLFREYHRLLADNANQFFDAVFEKAPR
ncbi:MAG: phenylacetic acid degradation operon negative regulatory protein PaaX [Dehalococcoidales bacterium]|nr:phenylacetic acid degradation operon negative regulatory protein PaaX [Dehalococcoidales bacterium]